MMMTTAAAPRPALKMLLFLQTAYFVLALVYNLASYMLQQAGQKPLAGGDPRAAAIVVALLTLTVAPGYLRWFLPYRALMGVMSFLAAQAILAHLGAAISGGIGAYSSWLSWALAVALITAGLVVFLMGMLGWYEAAPAARRRT